MKKFAFTGRNRSGAVVSGIEEAENSEVLLSRLQLRGLLITNIQIDSAGAKTAATQAKPVSSRARKFVRSSIKENDRVLFSRQLATALGSGVPLLKSLIIIQRQVDSKRLYEVVSAILRDVESGHSLREAIAKHPSVFSGLWVNLIEVGEASGNLPLILDRLAHYLEARAALKRKIISALFYPIIIFSVAILAIAIFLLVIVPRFDEIFSGMGAKLPAITQMLIFVSNFLRQKFLLILLAGGSIIFVIRRFYKTKQGKTLFDDISLKVPVLNEFLRLTEIEKFCSGMATLLEAGVPILYALEISERASNNTVVQDVLKRVKSNVREGKSLTEPLDESGFFPPMVTQMVGMGEEVGDLDKMFKKISSLYSDMLQTQIERFTSMFEPLMIVFMGGIIGIMIVAMFLPIFQMAQIGGH